MCHSIFIFLYLNQYLMLYWHFNKLIFIFVALENSIKMNSIIYLYIILFRLFMHLELKILVQKLIFNQENFVTL